jgi:hypothetical protein
LPLHPKAPTLVVVGTVEYLIWWKFKLHDY